MDSTINLLQLGLDGAKKRQEAISNNIANVDTPGYKRKDVDFLSVLKNAKAANDRTKTSSKVSQAKRPESSGLKMTNSKHLNSLSSKQSEFSFNTENNTKYRNDNNNVDIDNEMAEMAKTNLYYRTLAQRVSSKFSNLNEVISKGGS
ncbi:MAG: flagellar basal body rod protein FlgB [Bacillota bacterium]